MFSRFVSKKFFTGLKNIYKKFFVWDSLFKKFFNENAFDIWYQNLRINRGTRWIFLKIWNYKYDYYNWLLNWNRPKLWLFFISNFGKSFGCFSKNVDFSLFFLADFQKENKEKINKNDQKSFKIFENNFSRFSNFVNIENRFWFSNLRS